MCLMHAYMCIESLMHLKKLYIMYIKMCVLHIQMSVMHNKCAMYFKMYVMNTNAEWCIVYVMYTKMCVCEALARDKPSDSRSNIRNERKRK